MVLSPAYGSTKGKVDTHFSDATLAKGTCVRQDGEL